MTAEGPPASDAWTIGRLLTWTTDFLESKGADSPRLDAEVLLAHARGCPRIELYTAFEEEPPEPLRTTFRDLVKRRAAGIPVAYLVGHREFFSLSFEVTPDVLIPRPETEFLVVRALDLAKEMAGDSTNPSPSASPADRGGGASLRIADVGTGSGIIAVCCAKHLPKAHVTAIDISEAALAVAGRNAKRHRVDERVELVHSDLFEKIPPDLKFDLVLSNPPYVSTTEMAELSPEVREQEPAHALDGGAGGTAIIERLIPQAVERLKPGGRLLMEISATHSPQVEALLAKCAGLEVEETVKDLAGLPRVVQARRLRLSDLEQ